MRLNSHTDSLRIRKGIILRVQSIIPSPTNLVHIRYTPQTRITCYSTYDSSGANQPARRTTRHPNTPWSSRPHWFCSGRRDHRSGARWTSAPASSPTPAPGKTRWSPTTAGTRPCSWRWGRGTKSASPGSWRGWCSWKGPSPPRPTPPAPRTTRPTCCSSAPAPAHLRTDGTLA